MPVLLKYSKEKGDFSHFAPVCHKTFKRAMRLCWANGNGILLPRLRGWLRGGGFRGKSMDRMEEEAL